MRLKKNVVSLGSARVSCARSKGDLVEFFMAGDGIIVRKCYDLASRSLKTDSDSSSLAHAYLKLTDGAVMDLGELVYIVG